jgi:hypothetical protein
MNCSEWTELPKTNDHYLSLLPKLNAVRRQYETISGSLALLQSSNDLDSKELQFSIFIWFNFKYIRVEISSWNSFIRLTNCLDFSTSYFQTVCKELRNSLWQFKWLAVNAASNRFWQTWQLSSIGIAVVFQHHSSFQHLH